MSTPDRVLLDTSVVIALPDIDDLGPLADAEPLVSTVTIAELSFGLDVTDPVERLLRSQRLDAVVREFTVIPFDLDAARLYGTLAAAVRRIGRNPRPRRLDLQIAATAASRSVPLLTRNAADFVGLERLLTVAGT